MYEIAHNRDKEGYVSNWYDKLDDFKLNFFMEEYSVVANENKGDIYFSVETYYPSMIPAICNWGVPPLISF